MIISSPRSINDVDWINPFALTVDDEAPWDMGSLTITDDHNMQLLHIGLKVLEVIYPMRFL